MPPRALFAQLINGDEFRGGGGLSVGTRRLLCLLSPSQSISEEILVPDIPASPPLPSLEDSSDNSWINLLFDG